MNESDVQHAVVYVRVSERVYVCMYVCVSEWVCSRNSCSTRCPTYTCVRVARGSVTNVYVSQSCGCVECAGVYNTRAHTPHATRHTQHTTPHTHTPHTHLRNHYAFHAPRPPRLPPLSPIRVSPPFLPRAPSLRALRGDFRCFDGRYRLPSDKNALDVFVGRTCRTGGT